MPPQQSPAEAEAQLREYINTKQIRTLLGGLTEKLLAAQPADPGQWLREEAYGNTRTATPESEEDGEKLPIGFVRDPATGEIIESDGAGAEAVEDMNSLLLPGGQFPTDVAQFSVSYSRGALDGWVKQLSPCCAAASLSGAWNCVMGLKRHETGAMQKEHGIEVLRGLMQEKLDAKQASFERLLGAELTPLQNEIEARLEAAGKAWKHLGLKKPKADGITGVKKSTLLQWVREIVELKMASATDATADTDAHDQTNRAEPQYDTDLIFVRLSEYMSQVCCTVVRRCCMSVLHAYCIVVA
jgi:hypothetical protein